MDWLFGKKDEKPLGPITQPKGSEVVVMNKIRYFLVRTKSGSEYQIELDRDGKWWLHRKGRWKIPYFGDIKADKINSTNFQEIVGNQIWFRNPKGLGNTNFIKSIQEVKEAAA